MKRVRVIPVLLIDNGRLVKSVKFKNHTYVGDPINAVKIFNEKEVDEIVILDISATSEKRGPDMTRIQDIASEAFMPLAYGGGITTLQQIQELIASGVEKVILNTSAFRNTKLITDAARYVGSQSVVVSLDVKKNILGKYKAYIENGSFSTGFDPVTFAKKMELLGVGELILTSIEREGTYLGYDTELIQTVAKSVNIPVVALGGAATLDDFSKAIVNGASAVAAGSMFVFQRPHRAVLISYPTQKELREKLFTV